MVIPSPRPPTGDDARDIVRRCRLTPNSAEVVAPALAELVREIEADQAVPHAERLARRREAISDLKTTVRTLRRLVDAVETARPAGAAWMRKALGRDMGRFFSSAAYDRFLGLPVGPALTPRDLESRAATSRAGPYAFLEAHAVIEREEVASRHGHRLFPALAKHLADRLEADLEAERLNTVGRPAERARRIALVRLVQLHERLTVRPAPSQPSESFQDFAARCFEAIGLSTTGLDRAAERVFDLLRKRRKASA